MENTWIEELAIQELVAAFAAVALFIKSNTYRVYRQCGHRRDRYRLRCDGRRGRINGWQSLLRATDLRRGRPECDSGRG